MVMPAAERHLATHDRHLVRVIDRDLLAVVGAADLIPTLGLSGTPEQVREKLAGLARRWRHRGRVQPGGPDIPGELERFHAAATG